jgi:Uncharacterised nucleotidyltransferase
MHDQRRDSDLPTAVQFLRLCLRGRWDPAALEAASALCALSHVDWPAVCHVAQRESLAPLLYQITRNKGLAADLPPEVDAELRRAYLGTARCNAILFSELERLLPALAAAQVPVLLLKGAALAQPIYGNIALRPMSDLDLLVREKDLPVALRVLPAIGHEITPPLVYRSEVMLHRYIQVETVLTELHWSPFVPPYYHYSGLIDWVWQTALPVADDLGTSSAWTLGIEAQLLHLCGHIQLHHAEEEAKQLWLHDVAEVIVHYRDMIDWDEILSRAQEYDLVLSVQHVVAQVIEAYWSRSGAGSQPPVPTGVLERLSTLRPSPGEQRLHALLASGNCTGFKRIWADLVALPGRRAQLHFGWRNLFPPTGYMRACYRVPHRLLVPLYYPYRWFLAFRGSA